MLSSREQHGAYWALRIAFGLGLLIAGLDKFANMLVSWSSYLSPSVQQFIPIEPAGFMQIVGVVEIIVGLAILAGATRSFGYIAMLWLVATAANLISTGQYFDVAFRDILLAISAYGLARLSAARRQVVVVTETDEYRRAA